MTAARIDLIIAVVVILFAAAMGWATLLVDHGEGLFAGPTLLPAMVVLALFGLGGILGVEALTRLARGSGDGIGASRVEWLPFMRIGGPLLAIMFFYVFLLSGFGYLIATVITAPMAFFVFGARGKRQVLLTPVIVAAVLFAVFFKLLGMFDPPGTILDISHLL